MRALPLHTYTLLQLKIAAQTAPSGSLWNLGTGLVGSDALGDGVSWEALASNLSMPWMCWISTDAQSAESLLPGADISVTELLAPLNAAALPEAGCGPCYLHSMSPLLPTLVLGCQQVFQLLAKQRMVAT